MDSCSQTVEAWKTKLTAKLGLHDRVTLACFAIRAGLIPVWEE
jgi:DNA-binding NarL/FixJ family response regulator